MPFIFDQFYYTFSVFVFFLLRDSDSFLFFIDSEKVLWAYLRLCGLTWAQDCFMTRGISTVLHPSSAPQSPWFKLPPLREEVPGSVHTGTSDLLSPCLVFFYFLFFQLGYNYVTMLCYFLLFNKVNRLCVYIYPLPLELPSHPPRSPQSTRLGFLCSTMPGHLPCAPPRRIQPLCTQSWQSDWLSLLWT